MSTDKRLINPWDVIDTFFRDTSYYKSQHQLDSFNEFIFSEENGIRNIIKRENPFIIYKGQDSNTGKFAYEIKIYFGETLNDKTDGQLDFGEPLKDIDNIFVSSPSIYDEDNMKEMFPNDARLRNLTYKSNIFCNIGIHFIFHNLDESGKVPSPKVINFKKINIGSIPIMIHSKMCLLHNLDAIKLSEFGECPYDQGGYFIIKGKEKVILSLEKKVNNILYINSSSDENIILQGNIKSVSNEGFQSSRTNNVNYIVNKLREKIDGNTIMRHEKTFNVRVLGFDIEIPLFIMFRALGIISDKRILSLIIYEDDTDKLKNKFIELIRPSVKAAHPIFTQKSAFKFLSLNTGENFVERSGKQKFAFEKLQISSKHIYKKILRFIKR